MRRDRYILQDLLATGSTPCVGARWSRASRPPVTEQAKNAAITLGTLDGMPKKLASIGFAALTAIGASASLTGRAPGRSSRAHQPDCRHEARRHDHVRMPELPEAGTHADGEWLLAQLVHDAVFGQHQQAKPAPAKRRVDRVEQALIERRRGRCRRSFGIQPESTAALPPKRSTSARFGISMVRRRIVTASRILSRYCGCATCRGGSFPSMNVRQKFAVLMERLRATSHH